jgi:hypothetical protein
MTTSTRLALQPEYQGRTEAAFGHLAFTDEFSTINRKHNTSSSLVGTCITFHQQQYGRSG